MAVFSVLRVALLVLSLHLVLISSRVIVRDNGDIRIIAVSDTHGREFLPDEIPKGDIFIFAGDAVQIAQDDAPAKETQEAMELRKKNHAQKEMERALKAIKHTQQLPHPIKIFVPGNHDIFVDEVMNDLWKKNLGDKIWNNNVLGKPEVRNLFANGSEFDKLRKDIRDAYKTQRVKVDGKDTQWILLLHETVTVEVNGEKLKIFGTPFSQGRRIPTSGFTYKEDDTALWEKIEKGTDIVISHQCPKDDMTRLDTNDEYVLDRDNIGKAGGPALLTEAILENKVQLVVCGHLHAPGSHYHVLKGDSDVKDDDKTYMLNTAVKYNTENWDDDVKLQGMGGDLWTPRAPSVVEYNLKKHTVNQITTGMNGLPPFPWWTATFQKPKEEKFKGVKDISNKPIHEWVDADWFDATFKLWKQKQPTDQKVREEDIKNFLARAKKERDTRAEAIEKAYGDGWGPSYFEPS
ncbi:Uu.00g057680.m01.CDS01 [Anthostomella pinea]|uniref:Uu.00g057680.m01.CDS01 n=1 Tax=Anthostomella pinea TaxID=933095 RepID=A0AAI8VSL3_9PEZI|nr:Uu.00g057680.m01.CDS01 [Anthostomella pinea]